MDDSHIAKLKLRMKKIAQKLDFNIEDDQVGYIQQQRLYGDGRLRIGDKIELSPELYTLLFISAFKHSEIEKYIDVVSGELKEREVGGEEEQQVENIETKNLQKEIETGNDLDEKKSQRSPTSQSSSPKQGGIDEEEIAKLALLARVEDNEEDEEDDLEKMFQEHEAHEKKHEMSEEDLAKMLSVETMRTRRTIVLQNTLLCFIVQVLLCFLIIW